MKNIIILMFLLLVIQSCDTEDVLPGVSVELESETISEDNGLVLLTATLNGSVSNDITIPLQFSGMADINSDYSVSSNNISIISGSTTGSTTAFTMKELKVLKRYLLI